MTSPPLADMDVKANTQTMGRSFDAESDTAVRSRLFTSLEYLNRIGIALSQEKDINRLLETILTAAKTITNADGGTLYRLIDNKLKFEIVLNDSLKIAMGGTTGVDVPFYPIPLHQADGAPNNNMGGEPRQPEKSFQS